MYMRIFTFTCGWIQCIASANNSPDIDWIEMEPGMEAVYPTSTRPPTWSWPYLLKTVFISTCLLQVILAPGVGADVDRGEDTGGIISSPSLNNTNTFVSNSTITSKSLSQILSDITTTTTVSSEGNSVTPMPDYGVTKNNSDGVYRGSTTISESLDAATKISTTVFVPLLPLATPVSTTTTTTAAPLLITIPPGSQNKTDLTTTEAAFSNNSQTLPPLVDETTSTLDMGVSDNTTHNRTLTALPSSPFNLNDRVKFAIVAAFVAIVVVVVGKLACKKIEKRMVRTGDEEYANILEDAFSMATEENVWDARWSTGRDPQASQGAVVEDGDRKVAGEDSSLRAEHQRVTLHVPGSRPYGATESLMV